MHYIITHEPAGSLDSAGRLEGEGELVVTWLPGLDREEERPAPGEVRTLLAPGTNGTTDTTGNWY